MISSIVISPEGWVEIAYAEKHKQGDYAGIMEQIVVDVKGAKCRDEVDELVELAREIVDLGKISIRNPADSIDPRTRIKKRRAPVPVDDDDAEDDA